MRNRATTPLSKAKLRQSWSKYNLYNLSRLTTPQARGRTFFQQKWEAKSVLRQYHGEQVREAQWTKMFKRRLRGVAPMSPTYLARNDGTVESGGRGSGIEGHHHKKPVEATPYMLMTFAPLERRLDTAIFRSLFASSVRQARQFVVHGAVKVNGKKMRYPGYLLNPGDMFQVEPERVMFATGAPKEGSTPKRRKGEEASEDTEKENDEVEESEEQEESAEEEEEMDLERNPREILKDLQAQAKSIMASERAKLGAKKKQDLRGFTKAVKRMLSKSANSTILTDSLEAQFEELKKQLKIERQKEEANKNSALAKESGKKTDTEDGEQTKEEKVDEESTTLTAQEYDELFAALSESVDNPIDLSKPYATPWRPRDYMSAFAFIPPYLEVNQNICAAVYLRHPVARPGSAEVASPFGIETNASAFAWYLRRR